MDESDFCWDSKDEVRVKRRTKRAKHMNKYEEQFTSLYSHEVADLGCFMAVAFVEVSRS